MTLTTRPLPWLAFITALALPATAQHRPGHHTASNPPATPPTTNTTPPVAITGNAADGGASFSLRLDRGHGAEYPRTDYSRATVRVVPTLDHNRPAFQLYGRARFYTLDGEYHDLTCTLVVYADGTTLASRDYPCRDRSPTIDLANVDGMHVVTLSDSRVEFRIATATMITSQHVYRDIVFRLEARDGLLLTPPREYRP